MAVHPALLVGGAALLLLLLADDEDEDEEPEVEPGEIIPPGGVTDLPFEHCLDENMPPGMRDQINQILATIVDPNQLDGAAALAATNGFPKAAACLKQKADELRKRPTTPGVSPPGPIGPPPTGPTPTLGPMPFTVRPGDFPYALGEYYTGVGSRFKELEPLNPNLGPWVTRPLATGGTYQIYENWASGLKILLPLNWNPWTKPLPIPATQNPSTTMPTPGVGA